MLQKLFTFLTDKNKTSPFDNITSHLIQKPV